MRRFDVEGPRGVGAVDEPGGDPHPGTVSNNRDEARQERPKPPREQAEPANDLDDPLAEMRRLKVELARYRQHAERTSKVFLSVTNYAEWVRENARRDAELALRKARAKVQKLERAARDLERTEADLARVHDELARLQTLTDETRARLSAFLTTGLQVLNRELAAGQEDAPNTALGDLQNTLQERLASTSLPAPARASDVEGQPL